MKLQIQSSLGRRAQHKGLKMENRKKMITEMLFNKYGSLELSRGETATVLGISTSTLDRRREKGVGPRPTQDDSPKNAPVTYAIDHIADYMIRRVAQYTV